MISLTKHLRPTLATILCLCTLYLPAQLSVGKKMMKSGQKEKALSAFQTGMSNPIEAPACAFKISAIYRDTMFSDYQLDSAWVYLLQSETLVRKLKYKERNKAIKKYERTTVGALKKEIQEHYFEEVKEENTLTGYERFLSLFKRPSYKIKKQVIKARDAKAFEIAYNADQFSDYETLMSKYGKSLKESNRNLYKEAQMRLFETCMRDKSWDAYDEFAAQYPNNIYVRDSLRHTFEQIRTANDIDSYKNFIEKHPQSPYAAMAGDSLMVLAAEQELIEELEFLITYLTASYLISEAWLNLYRVYKITNGTVQGIYDFQDDYPGFPFPDMFEADVKQLIDQEYIYIVQEGDYERAKHFIEAYPDYAKIDKVWERFYELYKINYPTLKHLERFQLIYPKFPYPDKIEADKAEATEYDLWVVLKSNSLEKCLRFIEKHPEHPKRDSVWLKYYDVYKVKNPGLDYLVQFLAYYPDFPYPEVVEKDIEVYRAKEEDFDFENLQGSYNPRDYFAFAKKFPNSRFLPDMESPLEALVMDFYDLQTFEQFLKLYPNSKQRQQMMAAIYELTVEKSSLQSLYKFEKNYPDFPNKEQLSQEQKTAKVFEALELNSSYYLPDSKKAEVLQFIKSAAPSEMAYKGLYKLVQDYMRHNEWDKALEIVLRFEDEFGDKNVNYIQLKELLAKEEEDLEVASISPNINTSRAEFEGIISADDSTLYFTGRGRLDNLGGEDIFVAHRKGNSWSKPQIIPILSTIGDNESAESISADGTEMILFKSGELCYSHKTAEGWAVPVPLPKTINRTDWQADARLTADGQAIIFASRKSNRDIDIYVSEKQADGTWGEAVNLGRTINTSKTDRSPFLHPDMKTLYFSSDGHEGMGNLDVFKATRKGDSWTDWTTPINIGTEVNNKSNNWGYRVSTDGETAYFTNVVYKNHQIYTVTVPDKAKPGIISQVKGQISNQKGQALAATITWRNMENNRIQQNTNCDPTSGEFFTTLSKNIRYSYQISHPGYLPKSGVLDLSTGHRHSTIYDTLFMISKGLVLPLENLFFETGKYDIKSESFPALEELASLIKTNNLKIELRGHTDNVGSTENNMVLSQNRVKAVKNFLVRKGCLIEQISTVGKGEQQPIANNDTEEGRQKNRRVEFEIK